MRIRAQRDDLADVLARANRAVGTRTALPVLQGLLCEVSGNTLRVTGTDLDGERIEVRGCDLWTFGDEGTIVRKDSFWKLREP